jgi:hypothetical protein
VQHHVREVVFLGSGNDDGAVAGLFNIQVGIVISLSPLDSSLCFEEFVVKRDMVTAK